jgi:hypothetical protein
MSQLFALQLLQVAQFIGVVQMRSEIDHPEVPAYIESHALFSGRNGGDDQCDR